jgi:hypothetical protein
MIEPNWRSEVDVRELTREPAVTEEADLLGASHVETGALSEMVRFVMSNPEPSRGRFVLTFGERIMYRREIENLANRPDFPSD